MIGFRIVLEQHFVTDIRESEWMWTGVLQREGEPIHKVMGASPQWCFDKLNEDLRVIAPDAADAPFDTDDLTSDLP